MGVLSEKQLPLDQQLKDLTTKIGEISSEYGTNDLSSFFAAAVDRVNKTQSALDDIHNAIALAPSESSSGPAGLGNQPANSMSIAQIAATDPHMRDLVDQESHLEENLKRIQLRYGPKSDTLINAQSDIADAKDRIKKYADASRLYGGATGQTLGDPNRMTVNTAGRSLESLKESDKQLSEVYKEEHDEMVNLGKTQIELERLRQDLAEVQEQRDQIVRRTTALQAEDMLGGRLSITSTGEIPLGPEKDPRLKYAAAAGLAGAAFPAATLVLFSLVFKGKLRYSTDTEGDLAASILPTAFIRFA
jgi:uncharacterized protein involved in exopolysaccharide biosynthesis